jgi:HPt (histidine-containing phosphotransfer) domain-containing protein
MNNLQANPTYDYSGIELLDNETMNMLNEYAKGSPEIVKDIIDSFEPEAAVIIEDIIRAAAEKNYENLRIATHSLAGISGSIGAVRLKQACSDTENAIKAGKPEDALTNTPQIIRTFHQLIDLLKKM